jgi:hypothetical protein
MTATATFTPEQITALYAEFAKTAVDEFNTNGRFKPAIFLVARRIDGHVVAEMPEQLTEEFLSKAPDRLEFVVRALLTEGTSAREQVRPKPDAVVIITEAFDVAVPRNADGSPRALTAEVIAEVTASADEILAVQIFTSAEAWAGTSKIAGTPRRATFMPEVRKVVTFVTVPVQAPTMH